MAEFLIGFAIGFLFGAFVQLRIDKAAFEELKSKAVNELDAIERKIKDCR